MRNALIVLPALAALCVGCSTTPPPAPTDAVSSQPLPASVTRTLSAVPSLEDVRGVLGPSAEFERIRQGNTMSVSGECGANASVSSHLGETQGWRVDNYSAEGRRVSVDISAVAYPSEEMATNAAKAVHSAISANCGVFPSIVTGVYDATNAVDESPDIIEAGSRTVRFSTSKGTPCVNMYAPASTALVSVLSCVPGTNSNNAFRASTSLLSKTIGDVYAANGQV